MPAGLLRSLGARGQVSPALRSFLEQDPHPGNWKSVGEGDKEPLDSQAVNEPWVKAGAWPLETPCLPPVAPVILAPFPSVC